MPNLPPPIPLAMLVADQIYIDPATRKYSILGVFSELGAPAFPALHPALIVFCELTEIYGKIPLTLLLVDLDETTQPLLNQTLDISAPDPRAIAGVTFVFANIVFPHAGSYRLQLFSRDHFLVERGLRLRGPDDE